MKKIFIIHCSLFIGLLACLTGCKATRTIATTSTYTLVGDSTKTTTTIATKTVEEYIGTKKK